MTLTKEQATALERNGSIPLIIDGIPCFVLRADVFRRVEPFVTFDDSDVSPAAIYPAVVDAWDKSGHEQDAKDYLP